MILYYSLCVPAEEFTNNKNNHNSSSNKNYDTANAIHADVQCVCERARAFIVRLLLNCRVPLRRSGQNMRNEETKKKRKGRKTE